MWRDDGFLLDMLISAREASEMSSGLTFGTLEGSILHQNAILHVLQKIGEAATKVSEQFRNDHPDIAWAEIIGMRHRLVHDYRNINLTKVWESVESGVPRLIEQLERLVPPE
jgi:uncharacterized protein with HEPN domain